VLARRAQKTAGTDGWQIYHDSRYGLGCVNASNMLLRVDSGSLEPGLKASVVPLNAGTDQTIGSGLNLVTVYVRTVVRLSEGSGDTLVLQPPGFFGRSGLPIAYDSLLLRFG
jgi:hypothetical protein